MHAAMLQISNENIVKCENAQFDTFPRVIYMLDLCLAYEIPLSSGAMSRDIFPGSVSQFSEISFVLSF